MEQLQLPLLIEPNFSQYSYFVSESNKHVYGLINTWPNWSFSSYVVYAPAGYGKTHLAHIFKDCLNGVYLKVSEITEDVIISMSSGTLYLIDECNVKSLIDPSLLFHFYNMALEKKCTTMYFCKESPQNINFGLEDLNSRLRSIPSIEILQPDDLLCEAIMKKQFSDLQVLVSDEVIHFLLTHASRSLTDIQKNIEKLNTEALKQKRNITIPFIKETLSDDL
jgi:chromosomal replication initiation ATPase DnaA